MMSDSTHHTANKHKKHTRLRCRQCDAKAVINMRQHKLALCGPHYIEWVRQQTQRMIEKYHMFTPDERILVAVSGGKDSLALWDILLALGYHADGLYIGLGIDGGVDYSAESYGYVQDFVDSLDTQDDGPHYTPTLHTVDVAGTYGASIPAAARLTQRGRTKPCSVCGLTKRHIMNRIALDGAYDVLATGHNLDDEAAILLGNTMTWSVDYLTRQGPVLPPSRQGFARKVKPLFRFYEREMAAYAIVRGIEYIEDECPHAAGATSIRYKEMLNTLEANSPGIKLQFYLRFLNARKKNGLFPLEAETVALNSCPTCGQPTTNDGPCAFCRMWDRVRDRQSAPPAR